MKTEKIGIVPNKRKSQITGIFFITATISAIIGLELYDPILNADDFLIQGVLNKTRIISGVIFELILVCSAIGTGFMLYPFLKKNNESWALAYVCFRLIECVVIIVGITSVLGILSLSLNYSMSGNQSNYLTLGQLLKSIHSWTFILGPNFFLGINTLIYSLIFYRSEMIPRKINILGILGSVLIIIASILEMFGVIEQLSVWGAIIALPIAIFEMILAFYLIFRGLKN